VAGADVDDQVFDRERAKAPEPAHLSTRPERERRFDRVMGGRENREPRNRGGHERLGEGGAVLRLGSGRRRESEMSVEVPPCRVAIDEHDALAELREVDRQIPGDEALSYPAASPPDRDDAADAPDLSARVDRLAFAAARAAGAIIPRDVISVVCRRRVRVLRRGVPRVVWLHFGESRGGRARARREVAAQPCPCGVRARRSRPKMRAPSSGARKGFAT